jgi:hypothetical protein
MINNDTELSRAEPEIRRFRSWVETAPVLAVVATIVVGCITVAAQYIASRRALEAQMIEIGISVLRAPPTNEGTSIRHWAVDIVEKYSGSHFNDAQREAIMKNAMPFGGTMRPMGGSQIRACLQSGDSQISN